MWSTELTAHQSREPADVAATFTATLADEWARAGVSDVVVAPGLAVDADRVGGGRRTAAPGARPPRRAIGRVPRPRARSGHRTAGGRRHHQWDGAVELHPAVVEAHQARVPLIAVTADRPAELHDVGAPQTVDQIHLFGRAVRWFVAPGVPRCGGRRYVAVAGARTVAEAGGDGTGGPPGPVHLNLAFREPLGGPARDLPDPGPTTALALRRPGRITVTRPAWSVSVSCSNLRTA